MNRSNLSQLNQNNTNLTYPKLTKTVQFTTKLVKPCKLLFSLNFKTHSQHSLHSTHPKSGFARISLGIPSTIEIPHRLVGIKNNSNKEWNNHIDKETDEEIEVDSWEPPDDAVAPNVRDEERCKHIVAVHQWEETLWGRA